MAALPGQFTALQAINALKETISGYVPYFTRLIVCSEHTRKQNDKQTERKTENESKTENERQKKRAGKRETD